jgi:hypothetical protein
MAKKTSSKTADAPLSNTEAYEHINPMDVLSRIDDIEAELKDIYNSLKRSTRGVQPQRGFTLRARADVLKQRADLLFKLLAKVLPDQRAISHTGNLSFEGNSAEALPDDLLAAAVAGKLNKKQMTELERLMVHGNGPSRAKH